MSRPIRLLPALAFAAACGGPQRVERPIPGMMPPPVPIVVREDTAQMEADTLAMQADTVVMADTLPAVEMEAEPMAEPEEAMPPPPEEPAPDLGPGTIGPGFTERQVQEVLGPPLYTSGYGEHTFYFYDNGREKEAGFLDFVIFRAGRVVDAVFRHPDHHYAGNSSSPRGVTPKATPGGERLGVPPPPPETRPDTLPPR
jgi:hypothetical protein